MTRSTAHWTSRPAPDTSAGGPRRARQLTGSPSRPWSSSPERGLAALRGLAHAAPFGDRALVALPKAHLHLHLVGSMRRTTLAEWCERDGRPCPDLDLDAGGWPRFNSLYEAASASVRTAADLERLVDELVEDQARDGAQWVEVTADPSNYHGRIGSAAEVLAILLEAGRQAAARHDVAVGWIVCANRSRRPSQALDLAHLAAAHAGTEVVGFGLANDERAAATAEFTRAFAVARDAGLLAVPHAGELCGASNVEEAVRLLGASRVGHGVRALEDEAVLDLLVEREVILEVCPTSNHALGVYDGEWAGAGIAGPHPVDQLRAAGVRVCLNADDPLLFGAGLLDEYRFARDELSWGPTELAQSAATSIEGASCPEPIRRRMREDLATWVAEQGADPAGLVG